jgi:hypothetical protein
MRCDTCKQESPVVMRVVIAKEYNRILARPVYNCPACFERKERDTQARGSSSLEQPERSSAA